MGRIWGCVQGCGGQAFGGDVDCDGGGFRFHRRPHFNPPHETLPHYQNPCGGAVCGGECGVDKCLRKVKTTLDKTHKKP
jgi:hypothetical protein